MKVFFQYVAYALEHLLALPVAVGTRYTSILTPVAGWTMATTFGFLLTTVLACTTDAATGGIVDKTCRSRDGDFWIQGPLAGGWTGLWKILATREQLVIG
jgi:hypothetical protein